VLDSVACCRVVWNSSASKPVPSAEAVAARAQPLAWSGSSFQVFMRVLFCGNAHKHLPALFFFFVLNFFPTKLCFLGSFWPDLCPSKEVRGLVTTTARCHGSPWWVGDPSRRVRQRGEGTGCASGLCGSGDMREGQERWQGPWQRPVACTAWVGGSGAQPSPRAGSPASARASLGFRGPGNASQPLRPHAGLR